MQIIFSSEALFRTTVNVMKDMNLIHPGQALIIPRSGYAMEEIKQIQLRTGAMTPSMPPEDASCP